MLVKILEKSQSWSKIKKISILVEIYKKNLGLVEICEKSRFWSKY